ncbi:MFS transporter [Pseudonocardia bannensis]|uniref:MFS transporter n=1 Tax=Pseudonocardia bannensis TaxID=630973 RepID=A0A848DFC2_9PSEU|nr:MFS transporter [Pseudonocardia bannensis]NMH91264.1 MFS transporter [Pseudonocardia bannensis]
MAVTPERPTTSPASTVDSTPGWITVGAAFVSMAVVFGVAYSFGAFFAPMSAEFGTGSGATSIVFSFTAFCWFLLGSVSGRAVDRFGPRPVLLIGAVALAAGLIATSRVTQLWVGYLTYGLGVGIAVACGYVPMVAVVGGWFDRRRAIALAVAVAGIGVGTLAGAPLAAVLIDAYGWRRTNVIFAVAGAALLLCCALVARRPPEAEGAAPLPLRAVVRTRAFRSLYVSTLLASLALFVPFVFLPAFAVEAGVSPVLAATLVGVIGVASVLGRLAIGGLADRIGRIRTYQLSFAILAVSFLAWLFASPTTALPLLLVFTIVLGIGYGGWIALQPTVVAEVFGLRGLGGLVGLVYTAGGIGALIGAPLAGLVIDATGGYRWSIAGAMVCATGAFLALLPLGRGDFARSRDRC